MNGVLSSGYAIIPGVLSSAECEDLLVVSAQVQRSRAGARHLLSSEPIGALANDERLRAIAVGVLGDATPFRVTLFDKAPYANWAVVWHQDTALPLRHRFDLAGWGPWSTKAGVTYAHAPSDALDQVVALRIHLDDSLPTNGPLRVIPATHRLGVLSDEQVESIAHAGTAVDCVVERGGIVVMRPLLIHASAKIVDARPRRVLHIEYATSLTLAPGIELATA